MGRRRVEVVVVLLDVLAVVALAAGQPEQPLLQDRVGAVPEGEGEAEPLLLVGDAQETVFAPAVGAGAGVVVREGIPGRAEFGVVLADGAPLPLRRYGPQTRHSAAIGSPSAGVATNVFIIGLLNCRAQATGSAAAIARMNVAGDGRPAPTYLLSNFLSQRARIEADLSVADRAPTGRHRPVVACALTVVPTP